MGHSFSTYAKFSKKLICMKKSNDMHAKTPNTKYSVFDLNLTRLLNYQNKK